MNRASRRGLGIILRRLPEDLPGRFQRRWVVAARRYIESLVAWYDHRAAAVYQSRRAGGYRAMMTAASRGRKNVKLVSK